MNLIEELTRLVGAENVTTKTEDLVTYECDGLTLHKSRPDVVVFACDTADVIAIVKLANQLGIPFVARGAGTGLSGGAIPVEGGIVLSLTRMNQILEVDLENRRAFVQPGLVNLHLTEAVSGEGYYYAPDPSSQQACTIGGNVAENAGGPHCLKYGVTTNHVLGLEVVLPDGEVINVGGAMEDLPGYDLTGLLVGSEGTLGIFTEATVKLMPKVEAVKTLMAVFETIEDASNTVSEVISSGILPAAIEMMDKLTLEAVEAYIHAGYPTDAGAVLLIELDGLQDGLEEMTDQIVKICGKHRVRRVRIAQDDEERALLWAGRKRAFGAMGRISPSFYVQDGVIPRSKLPEVLTKIAQLSEKYQLRVANVFHAGDGNLHPLILFDERKEEEVKNVALISEEILKVCVDVGGALSGEHGIGLEKIDAMSLVFTDDDLEVMRKVRTALNPKNLCNPGKIFPTPGRCVELRPTSTQLHPTLERW